MASKMIKVAAFALTIAGLTLASTGLMSVIGPTVYAFFQSITLKSAFLYFGASTLSIAPFFIFPSTRARILSKVNEILSRFSWRLRATEWLGSDEAEFTNKSPFAAIKKIDIKHGILDGSYHVSVKADNRFNLTKRLREAGLANLIGVDNWSGTIELKSGDHALIRNFFAALIDEAPEIKGMIRKYQAKLNSMGLNTHMLGTATVLPTWVTDVKVTEQAHLLRLVSTDQYSAIKDIKIKHKPNAAWNNLRIELNGEVDGIRDLLAGFRLPYVRDGGMFNLHNLSKNQLVGILNALDAEMADGLGEATQDFVSDIPAYPQQPVARRLFAQDVDQDSPAFENFFPFDDFEEFDIVDNAENEEDVEPAGTFEERFEALNQKRKAKGEAPIDSASIPEEFLCSIMMTLMDDPVYDPRAPQRYDFIHIRDCLNRKSENPTNRQPLYEAELIHDKELQNKIRTFIRDLEKPKPIAVPAVKAPHVDANGKKGAPITPLANRYKKTSRKKPVKNAPPKDGVAARLSKTRRRQR